MTCLHCAGRTARRRDGICDACHAYRAKYGVLPPEGVLVKRAQRDLERTSR